MINIDNILNNKEISHQILEHKDEVAFYRLNNLSTLQNQHVNISGALINKIVQHVKKKINSDMAIFKDVYFVKYSNSQTEFMPGYVNNDKDNLLVFMVQLTSIDMEYLINNEIIKLSKCDGILLDPKKQKCQAVLSEDKDEFINVLFFNFLIKDRD